ncbi:hypothetical protein SAMN04488000_123102 [Lentzea albida]|uniref:Uncharacterized protein n=1 Tax=Lentzea albida TaxID=65499 RepID=A0A1H9WNB3_9PSEU|nr:hypothetical protein SAMN04488000_123102 [Lentzea albida]
MRPSFARPSRRALTQRAPGPAPARFRSASFLLRPLLCGAPHRASLPGSLALPFRLRSTSQLRLLPYSLVLSSPVRPALLPARPPALFHFAFPPAPPFRLPPARPASAPAAPTPTSAPPRLRQLLPQPVLPRPAAACPPRRGLPASPRPARPPCPAALPAPACPRRPVRAGLSRRLSLLRPLRLATPASACPAPVCPAPPRLATPRLACHTRPRHALPRCASPPRPPHLASPTSLHPPRLTHRASPTAPHPPRQLPSAPARLTSICGGRSVPLFVATHLPPRWSPVETRGACRALVGGVSGVGSRTAALPLGKAAGCGVGALEAALQGLGCCQ